MLKKEGFLYQFKRNKVLILMITPVLLYFFIQSYLPMIGIYLAFTKYNMNLGFLRSPFVGLDNFKFLFQSGTLFKITANTILYNIAFIFIGNFLQITIAIFINDLPGKVFKRISQSVIFLPYFISFVIVGVFVYNIFNYDTGFLNTVLKAFGFGPFDAYNTPWIWKYIIVAFYIWKQLGYGTIIYLAAIAGIGKEYYEAADIDGANIFQKIRHVTLPLLTPTFIILLLLSLGGIMRGQFDLFYQLIGNNGILFNTTDILDTYVYRSLTVIFDPGLGAAAGLYQSIFGLITVMTVNFLIKRKNEEFALF